MAGIEFQHLTKIFGEDVRAVDDLSLVVEEGELLVLLGPSGCGKSTLLRLVAGLETASGGDILLDGERINDQPPQARDVAMVFQNYALYPHKTVRQNLAFPLRMMRKPKGEIEERIQRAAGMLGLTPYLDRKPGQLSGGQSQRAAMGRAIVRDPSAFLMDEPLSNLDAKLRTEVRAEIAELQRELGITTLYVTHDQVEAMTLGQRIAVLREGRLQQVDTAQRIFERPANTFVAAFLGNPGMNLFRGRLGPSEDHPWQVTWGEVRIGLPETVLERCPSLRQQREGPIVVGIRPESFRLDAEKHGGETTGRFRARVKAVEALGHEKLVYLHPPGEMAGGESEDRPAEEEERRDPVLAARLPASAEVGTDDELTLCFRPAALHFFTADGEAMTGERGAEDANRAGDDEAE